MHIRGTILVTYQEWMEFLEWYKKYSNIRVLNVKDKSPFRYIIDKKDKSYVAYSHGQRQTATYGIYQPWYERYMDSE